MLNGNLLCKEVTKSNSGESFITMDTSNVKNLSVVLVCSEETDIKEGDIIKVRSTSGKDANIEGEKDMVYIHKSEVILVV